MRRFLVVALVAGLIGGALVGPADAKKKKPKPAPLVTFEAAGSVGLGNPADLVGEASVTRQEFLATCAIPASQGVDGFVIELPAEISALSADVKVSGTDATGMYDLDLHFFSDTCSSMGSSSTAESNEYGFIAPGTKFVLVNAFVGAGIDFTFEAVEKRS